MLTKFNKGDVVLDTYYYDVVKEGSYNFGEIQCLRKYKIFSILFDKYYSVEVTGPYLNPHSDTLTIEYVDKNCVLEKPLLRDQKIDELLK